MSVAEFVAGVDRLLTRAHELYPSGAVAGQLTGGGAASAVPGVPDGSSALRSGASTAGVGYERSQVSVGTLDQELERAAGQGTMVAAQGRTGSGAILAQARTFARSAAPLGNTAAGAQLVVATMDQHVQAMQTQLQQTTTANQAVTSQLREAAAGYHSLAGGEKDAPATPLDSKMWKPGDPRHQPYIAGPGGLRPPNPIDSGPGWLEIGPGSGNFVRADELPGMKVGGPGMPGPPPFYDKVGNEHSWLELGPKTGVWAPDTDFPNAKIVAPGSGPPPYGYQEYLPGSGIFLPNRDLIPEPLMPSSGATHPAGR
ncbi:hypothetical protein [Mycobacterium sp.]|uniref:hypothetical protein n=1 Tax=Mycobacterium sp. TaxID=1785 RepID=UPI0031D67078